MFRLIRPNTNRLFNNIHIRRNCNLNCNDKCVNLLSQQTQSLNTISKQTGIITILSVINFMAPIVLIGATSVAALISHLMH